VVNFLKELVYGTHGSNKGQKKHPEIQATGYFQ
jgi:hypothetical protein